MRFLLILAAVLGVVAVLWCADLMLLQSAVP
jgi:hypothetical protein